MQEFGKHIPDVTTFAANLVVFLAAIGAAVAGSLAMVKKVKKDWEETFPKSTTTSVAPASAGGGDVVTQRQMIGTLMMETTTAAMLSESQSRLADTMDEVKDEMRDLRNAVCAFRDETRELRHELQFHRK